MSLRIFFACSLLAMVLIGSARGAEPGGVLGVLEDFTAAPLGPYQRGQLDFWRWDDARRAEARTKSRLEIVDIADTSDGANGAGKALRVRIDDAELVAAEPLPLLRLAPHYPPEADAIRLRLQVVSGRVALHVGGPTAYYGNSDVFTQTQTLRADTPPRWIDVVCSLNHPTWRNYRRAGFSTDAPRNYYNRWAQEPLALYLAAGSQGEVLIDRIEVVALGEGKPFPKFAPEQVRHVRTIADFETSDKATATHDDLARVFTVYMAATEAEWFAESWRRTKPLRFPPAKLSIVDAGLKGRRSLACEGFVAEEVNATGLRTEGSTEANAIAATVRLTAPSDRSTLVGVGPALPLDFLVFTAPRGKPAPWSRFAASAELRAMPGPGFDYQLTHRTLADVADADFAIYQTRRFLKPDEWTQLVLPAADFTCVYGHGAFRAKLTDHEPLACDEIIAVAWLNPWCRSGRREATDKTLIDELSLVHVPGTSDELRSYWQVPDVKTLITRDGEVARRKTRLIALPGDVLHEP